MSSLVLREFPLLAAPGSSIYWDDPTFLTGNITSPNIVSNAPSSPSTPLFILNLNLNLNLLTTIHHNNDSTYEQSYNANKNTDTCIHNIRVMSIEQ